jgi:hypothetical protein
VRWEAFRRGFVAEAFVDNFEAFRTQGEVMFAAAPVERVYLQHLTQRTARELAALPLLARVRCLVLAKSDMGDAGLQELFRSPHLADLVELRVGIAHVGPARFAAIAAAGLPNLATLELDFQALDDAGARAFAAAANFPRLTTLSLGNNAIGDTGAQALADCPGLAGLVHLDLFANPIGDDGARALAQSPHLARLADLKLYENRITAAGAGALIDSSHLESLTKVESVVNPITEGRPAGAPEGPDPGRPRSLCVHGAPRGPIAAVEQGRNALCAGLKQRRDGLRRLFSGKIVALALFGG